MKQETIVHRDAEYIGKHVNLVLLTIASKVYKVQSYRVVLTQKKRVSRCSTKPLCVVAGLCYLLTVDSVGPVGAAGRVEWAKGAPRPCSSSGSFLFPPLQPISPEPQ